jgi:hypothetical protein
VPFASCNLQQLREEIPTPTVSRFGHWYELIIAPLVLQTNTYLNGTAVLAFHDIGDDPSE